MLKAEIHVQGPNQVMVFVPVHYRALELEGGEDTPPLGQIEMVYVTVYECELPCTGLDLEPLGTTATVHVWPIARERIRNVTHDFGWVAPLIAPWVTTPPKGDHAPAPSHSSP